MRPLSVIALSVLALPATALAQNEECTGAVVVVNGANGPFSNVGSTTSLPAWPCGLGDNDIWFTYAATCTGIATIDTCGSGFDTVLQVFDPACGNTCAANFPGGGPCDDDTCSLQSTVVLPVRNALVYYIRVGGFSGATGSFSLNVSCAAGGGPPDDECSGATPVVLGLNGPYSNVGYNTSVPTWPCGGGGSDRWFSFTANCTAPHTFFTCGGGTDFDTTLEVFDGGCPCNLNSLGCNDDTCNLQSQVTANLTQNQSYLIRVGGYFGATGNFELHVATGTNTGAFTTQPHACNGGSHVGIVIAATGNPNIGGAVTVTANAFVGVPVIGYGFQIPPFPLPYFCCTIGHDYTVVFFGATSSVSIPCAPSLIGASVYSQGLDFTAPSGCTPGPGFNLSDTIQITIG